LPNLLYGWENWVIGEQDKFTITSAEIKFVRRKTKYTLQDYKTNEGILSEFIINPAVKKIQTYGNKWAQHFRRMD